LNKIKFPRFRKKTTAIIVAILLLLVAAILLAYDQLKPEPESPPQEEEQPAPDTGEPEEQPEETPPIVEFSVTKITASVNPPSYSSTTCSKKFTFTGKITTNKAGTVKYLWERSDGYKTAATALKFSKAETKSIYFYWTVSGDYAGWIRLKTTSPGSISSSKASFTETCVFAVTKVTASVSPSTNDACTETYTFTGKITTNKAGTVKYQWERAFDFDADGEPEAAPSSAIYNLKFTKAGTKTVSEPILFGDIVVYSPFEIHSIPTWLAWLRNLFAPVVRATFSAGPSSGWERIKVTSPNSKTSNKAEFVYDGSYCVPPPAPT
jgi:hypothetical protein